MSDIWSSEHGARFLWQSGPWSVEVREDELANLKFEGRIILRSIRSLIRDRNWNTPELRISNIQDKQSSLKLELLSSGFDAHFQVTTTLEVDAQVAHIRTTLKSNTDFMANRVGLNVLHPPQLLGQPIRVGHPDGSFDDTKFPNEISPHQPAQDISSLAWSTGDVSVSMEFAGEIFEMEDQRNWTDASFKTYSRPLAMPFPFEIFEGEEIAQEVEVRVERDSVSQQIEQITNNEINLEATEKPFPQVQVGAATAPEDSLGIGQTGKVPKDHNLAVLVELDLNSANWPAALARAASGGAALDIRVTVRAGEAALLLKKFLDSIQSLRVLRIGIYDGVLHVSTKTVTATLLNAMKAKGLKIPVVGGTRAHFTELNRSSAELPDELAGITFAITPLFHSQSTEQLIESLAMQRVVVAQALKIATGKPVHVGPITLQPRFNNVSTAEAFPSSETSLLEGYGAHLEAKDDLRQQASELGAWTVASAAALAVEGVSVLTYFEEWGPRGLMTRAGREYPVQTAILALAALEGGQLLSGQSGDGLLWAVGSRKGGVNHILVANMRNQSCEATIHVGESALQVFLERHSWQKLESVDPN